MKKLYLFFLILLAGLGVSEVKGSHAMGADLTYNCLGPGASPGTYIYRVRLSFYRDCAGITPGASMFITVSSATCAQNLSLTANLLAGYPQEVSPLCPAQIGNSTCNGGTLPGVQQYIYEGNITLPMQCADWVFSWGECCRNAAITNLVTPDSYGMTITANLNNLAVPCNNSPDFTTIPVPYICAGQNYIYNHGAVDPDGDSLVYSLVSAVDGTTPLTYVAPYSAVNPMASAPPVSINSTNGNLTVTPTGVQVAVICVRVDEYRNGVLIGSVVRDIQVTVLNCTNNPPVIGGLAGVTGGVQTGPYSVQICPGQTLSFTIPGSDVDAGQTITWSWNNGIPGGVLTTPSGPSPQNATFTWTPTAADVGLNALTVTLRDNACPVLGTATRAIDITVMPGTTAGPDQVYCPSAGAVPLTATGGTSFTWNILSGTPGSLSCTNCATTNATPLVTTTYEVVSNLASGCRNRDTVVVTVAPSFALGMSPNQTICLGGSTAVAAIPNPAGTYTYQWSPASGLSSTSIGSPTATPTSTTTYTVTVTSAAGCRMIGSTTVTVDPTPLSVAPSATPTQSCAGSPVTLNSNYSSGSCSTYVVTSVPFAPVSTAGFTSVSLGDDQVSGAVPIGFNFTFYCNTKTQAYISSNGFITFNGASGSGCCSGSAVPTATITDFIAGTWNDLYPPAGGSISYGTIGTAPNRRFVVDYTNINHCCSAGPINTFQIILYETSNYIEIHSTTITDDGSTHTMGIGDGTGANGIAVTGRNGTSGWTATNDAYRFAPQVGAAPTITWQSPLGNTIGTGTSLSVTPASSTTYYAIASNGICSASGSVTVDVTSVNAGPDVNICPAGGSTTFNAVYSGPPPPSNCNVYTVGSIGYAPYSGGTWTSVSLGDDQVSGVVPIGFNFTFFCSVKTQLYISSNGFITFNGASGSGCCSGSTLPTGTITDFIAGTWNDLYPPAGGTIQYQTTGTAPNRMFVVEYSGINHCCSAGPINTFQIKLFETSNLIEIHSTTITDDGSTHTMGIQDASGANFVVVPGRAGTNFTATNDAYRFTPQVGALTWTWSPATYLSSTTVNNPTASSVAGPITYTVTVSNGTCTVSDQVNVTICLPVENLALDGKKVGSAVQLDWIAVNEDGTSFYGIERSGDGVDWTEIGTTLAEGGPNQTTDYRTFDQSPLAGRNMYRLRAVDTDGAFQYSNTVEVYFDGQDWVSLSPNPAQTFVQFEMGISDGGTVSLDVFGVDGKLVLQKGLGEMNAGIHTYRVDVQNFPNGVYSYTLRTPSGLLNGKFVVEK